MPATLHLHDAPGSAGQARSRSGAAALPCGGSQPALGCRCDVHSDQGRLLLSGCCARRVQTTHRGLGHGQPPAHRADVAGAGHGAGAATSHFGDPSFGPGVPGRIQPVVATPLIEEVFMGRPAGWMHKLTGRGAMRSPGAPSHRREIERRFWEQIATGITSERAAEAVGVSQAVGTRWFRHSGGMPLFMSSPISGRYLSFDEREEIGLLSLQGVGVREIARRIGRSPSTVSRELTRNAATRSGQLEYRASVAQWKAELVAKRPKPSKLVANPRLRHYVQDRLEGKVRDAKDGVQNSCVCGYA